MVFFSAWFCVFCVFSFVFFFVFVPFSFFIALFLLDFVSVSLFRLAFFCFVAFSWVCVVFVVFVFVFCFRFLLLVPNYENFDPSIERRTHRTKRSISETKTHTGVVICVLGVARWSTFPFYDDA